MTRTRKQRGVGRVESPITPPPTSVHAAVNTRGFAALADEIYLEIVSYMPSVPIPTDSKSYSEIRRSRHETFLSLTQTSRSLRRFFWRYLWQRIEVREGTKIGNKDDSLKEARTLTSHKKYATELVRQLEIVTIRNPQLAQYVNYLDIFIGEYSAKTVLAELARCLGLFQNLHTVQIDVDLISSRLPLEQIFEQTFKQYSYPQIRNVFITRLSVSFVASCPQARHVGFTPRKSMTDSYLQTIADNCPRLEVLEVIGDVFWTHYKNIPSLIVDSFPNLRTIQFTVFIVNFVGNPSPFIKKRVNILKKLNHLQTIIMRMPPPIIHHWLHQELPTDGVKEYWIESAKHILIDIQLRDNLEKTVVMLDYDGAGERRILLKPKFSLDLEEGSFT